MIDILFGWFESLFSVFGLVEGGEKKLD